MVASDDVSQEQKLRNLEHFMKSLSIKYVAAGTLKKLVEAGHDSVKKLLSLTVADVERIEGFKKTSATNVVTALKDVKKASCVDMMAASNLFGRGLGERKIKTIVQAHPSILKGDAPTLTQLTSVEGIGEVTAKSFLSGLAAFFAFMQDIGMPCRPKVTPQSPAQTSPAAPNGPNGPKPKAPAASTSPPKPRANFAGMTIVFTGFRNKGWEELIEATGGKVSSSISKNTSLVVAADPTETSGKITKAKQLNIRIMSKDDFATENKLV